MTTGIGSPDIPNYPPELMSIDIRSPFFVSCGAAVLALVLLFATWNRPEELRRITR